jgi:hydroxymethylpyrimidine pyrophosphatase-like HAD family hydrolase
MCNTTDINNKGWIALDIDGTVTPHLHTMPEEVALYLQGLAGLGWRIAFITGRTFSFGYSVLKALQFPYFLAVQNGADILLMPERRLISRTYFDHSVIDALESAYKGQKEDFLVYAGYEKGDFCYYRPSRFSPLILQHVEKIRAVSPEPWVTAESFTALEQQQFPLIKCLGPKEPMQQIQEGLSALPELHVTMIRDPMSEDGIYLNLVTSAQATKGHALERLVTQCGGGSPVIAAGDDSNDVSMLQRADVRIVMETAPPEVLAHAHIIAPPADRLGIIQALNQAIYG